MVDAGEMATISEVNWNVSQLAEVGWNFSNNKNCILYLLSGCRVDTTLINMHGASEVFAEGHGHTPQFPHQGERRSHAKVIVSYIILLRATQLGTRKH